MIVHWLEKDVAIISIIVAYIGYLNWEAGQNKFRSELFEKRWEIYEQLIKALSIVMREGNIEFDDTMKLLAGLQRHKINFFFGHDIQEYISEIYSKCIHIQAVHNKLSSDIPVGEERAHAAQKWEELANDLGNQLSVAQVKFKSYLYFGNL